MCVKSCHSEHTWTYFNNEYYYFYLYMLYYILLLFKMNKDTGHFIHVCSFLPPYASWDGNTDCQTWWRHHQYVMLPGLSSSILLKGERYTKGKYLSQSHRMGKDLKLFHRSQWKATATAVHAFHWCLWVLSFHPLYLEKLCCLLAALLVGFLSRNTCGGHAVPVFFEIPSVIVPEKGMLVGTSLLSLRGGISR